MTNAEAIETLRANYPDACYEQLREAVDAAIEALKAQDATGDTISRQAAIDALDMIIAMNYKDWARAQNAIRQLPSAQPEQNGYWRHYEGYLTCSECGTEYYDDIMEYCGDDVPKFCPCCGAKMEA